MHIFVNSILRVFCLIGCAILFFDSAAFSQQEGLNEELVPTFLTSDENPATRDYWPAFSPDGKTVLFSRTPSQRAKSELFVVPAAGGEARRLIDSPVPVSATRANWSRTGLIAFTGGTRSRQQQLWIVNSDGSDPKRVVLPGLSNSVVYPSWYADGKRLVVLDAGKRVLQSVDLKDKTATAITNPDEFLVGMPSVSPIGELVAFAGQKNNGGRYNQTKNSICVIDGETARTVESGSKQGRTPNWSPNGRWIAFESNRDSPNPRHYAIFIMDKEGKHLRRMTPYSWRANHPVWSPDGSKMVFAATHPKHPKVSGIAIMSVDVEDVSGH